MYSLYKFSYSEVKQFLERNTTDAKPLCTSIFLGLEYEKRVDGDEDLDSYTQCWSPYSNPYMYNKEKHRPWFAVDTSGFDLNIENVQKNFAENLKKGQFFEGNFLRLLAIQDLSESSIIAQARSVLCWLDRNKFCASCGTMNTIEDAGSKLSCSNQKCKSNDKLQNKMVPSNIHYPRVDPVAIMLIINPARTHLLLGRKKQFPKNMFSCLAGLYLSFV